MGAVLEPKHQFQIQFQIQIQDVLGTPILLVKKEPETRIK